jgi:hypothetical protein
MGRRRMEEVKCSRWGGKEIVGVGVWIGREGGQPANKTNKA